jgi:hypothetical protein
MSLRDCAKKFNIYLLYADRPKLISKTYAVQIDVYHHSTLTYRASWIFPLAFPFLPVHRLTVLLRVPLTAMQPIDRCQHSCIHGQCLTYVNNMTWTFCRCQSGWHGQQCDRTHDCNCSSESLCIHRSVCLCPLNRFGSRCHLIQTLCRPQSCLNGGQCVPIDARFTHGQTNKFICICSQGYRGDRCEQQEILTAIVLSFDSTITMPSFVFLHLITVQSSSAPNRTTLIRNVPFNHDRLIFKTLMPFHLAFVQLFERYYLVLLRENAIVSMNLSIGVLPSYRCRALDELFNRTWSSLHLLKRIKYYHMSCQNTIDLVCFYDEIHLCLCTSDRQSNCFEFDHHMTYDCQGSNLCDNQALCIQDRRICPTVSFCACRRCYFRSTCQFSTHDSMLSLDIILGYHIESNTSLIQQPNIVQWAMTISFIMFIIGIVSSFLSIQTFLSANTRHVDCGLYLLASLIISAIVMTIFIF